MNKKLLFALSLCCAGPLSFAQAPSLTAANIQPALNDSFISVTCDTTGIVQGPSGASQTWDFHTLTATTLIQPLDTGYVVYASGASGYALLSLVTGFTANLATQGVGTTTANYYNETPSVLYNAGTYKDNNNNAVYLPAVQIFQFPFTYGTSFNSPYSGAITVAGITATEAGTVTVTGDGYGTLILPPTPPSSTNRNFTGVLRVHTFQSFRDSAAIFGSVQTDTIETYTWYQPGYHTALMTISTVRGALLHLKTVSYAQKQIANHENVPTVGLDASLRVFPNPAGSYVNLEFDNTGSSADVTLEDLLGRKVATIASHLPQGYNQLSYNSSSVAKGVYLIHITSGSESVTRKIEIQ